MLHSVATGQFAGAAEALGSGILVTIAIRLVIGLAASWTRPASLHQALAKLLGEPLPVLAVFTGLWAAAASCRFVPGCSSSPGPRAA